MSDRKRVLRDTLAAIINEIIYGTRISVLEIKHGFALDIPVEYDIMVAGKPSWKEKRRQFVYLTYGRKTLDDQDLIQVFTICGPEDPKYYRCALHLNMNMSVGAFGISQVELINRKLKRSVITCPSGTTPVPEIDTCNYFVMVDTFLADVISTERIRKSVNSLAEAGDRMEKLLVGKDIS